MNEIENQIKMRMMSYYGSDLNLADGVSLYANSLDTGKHIYEVNHNKDGSKNKNIHGFNFEAHEVGAMNREAVIKNSGKHAVTSDQLAKEKENKKVESSGEENNSKNISNKDKYTKKNHQQVDVIIHKGETIVTTHQLKHVKDIKILYEAKYTTKEGAPKRIVIHDGRLMETKIALDNRVKYLDGKKKKTADPEARNKIEDEIKRIKIAKRKLKEGYTKADDSYSPNLTLASQTAQDVAHRTAENVGKATLQEIACLAAGGSFWEI